MGQTKHKNDDEKPGIARSSWQEQRVVTNFEKPLLELHIENALNLSSLWPVYNNSQAFLNQKWRRKKTPTKKKIAKKERYIEEVKKNAPVFNGCSRKRRR